VVSAGRDATRSAAIKNGRAWERVLAHGGILAAGVSCPHAPDLNLLTLRRWPCPTAGGARPGSSGRDDLPSVPALVFRRNPMLTTGHVDHFRTFGFTVLRGYLADRVSALRAEVDAAIRDGYAATYDERVVDGISGHYLPMASRLTPVSRDAMGR